MTLEDNEVVVLFLFLSEGRGTEPGWAYDSGDSPKVESLSADDCRGEASQQRRI